MKIAVLGPVTKDYVTIDGDSQMQIGGIPYYVALTLKNLGVEEVVSYITFNKDDEGWVKDNFAGMDIRHMPVEKTLESYLEYSSSNPDVRKHEIKCYPNTINPSDELIDELDRFDYIILAPLFHDNISFELFVKLKHKNLVLGNFGMFTYGEGGKFVRKNPENLIRVLPYLQYLFLDNNEAIFVSGKRTIFESADFFKENGLANLIITEGSKGSHVFSGNEYYKIPAFVPEAVVDPTGAGDTYLAAFVRSIEMYNDPEKQGLFASMVASISLEKRGAFDSNLEDVLKRF
ncbi:MAG: PfkB family carbohydrate kinase [Leadbetterella sp.]|nr:PfkB family carbohydrate kinase [Leadbetterella sp.]